MAGKDKPGSGEHDSGVAVQESRPKVKEPARFKVILLNDGRSVLLALTRRLNVCPQPPAPCGGLT